MELSLDSGPGHTIKSYQPGTHFNIDGKEYPHSLILTSDTIITKWPVATITQLQAPHIEVALAIEGTILILGTGESLQYPDNDNLHALQVPLSQRGAGLEVMDTAAACRTYNLLMMEGREVIAALIL